MKCFGAIVKSIEGLAKTKIMFSNDVQQELSIIDNLEGIEFENYIGQLVKRNGYKNVTVTKGSGDFGADIIATKNGIKYAIQCKRFSSTVSSQPIGEVLRAMNAYKCQGGIVITNNYFTKQAIQEGEISNVQLWDRDVLISMLNSMNKQQRNDVIVEESEIEEKIC